MFCFVESVHKAGIDMHSMYADIKHKAAVLERMPTSVVLRGNINICFLRVASVGNLFTDKSFLWS